jgi:hypothetical protein
MADAGVGEKLKVFISYSRKGEGFAQELVDDLELTGFQPYMDKHEIAAGEDGETRLGRLLEETDTVVFVISPDAVASGRCAWEVKRHHRAQEMAAVHRVARRRGDGRRAAPEAGQLHFFSTGRTPSSRLSWR